MSGHPHAKTVEFLHRARAPVARLECGQLSENEEAKALAAADAKGGTRAGNEDAGRPGGKKKRGKQADLFERNS